MDSDETLSDFAASRPPFDVRALKGEERRAFLKAWPVTLEELSGINLWAMSREAWLMRYFPDAPKKQPCSKEGERLRSALRASAELEVNANPEKVARHVSKYGDDAWPGLAKDLADTVLANKPRGKIDLASVEASHYYLAGIRWHMRVFGMTRNRAIEAVADENYSFDTIKRRMFTNERDPKLKAKFDALADRKGT